MTNSMIPYSFIPGTKAKAGEVNANFIALADVIDANKASASSDIENIKEILNTKADKTELINEHTVTESDTDLNDYKTKGTYIFSATYKPKNIPKGEAGMLLVTGDEKSTIKQIWFCEEENSEIFNRNFSDNTWSDWLSNCGIIKKENLGYLKLSNGLIIQWGGATSSSVTYPIAYETFVCPIFSKTGYNPTAERSDTGFTRYSLTGLEVGSSGLFQSMNWIVIGY